MQTLQNQIEITAEEIKQVSFLRDLFLRFPDEL